MSSSKAPRSCSDTFGSFRIIAVESTRSERVISSPSSCRTWGCGKGIQQSDGRQREIVNVRETVAMSTERPASGLF